MIIEEECVCIIPVQGAKIVGRLAADPSGMMAGSISGQATSPTMAIPSYPNIGDLDPTTTATIYPPPRPPPSSTSDQHHQLDTAGEEQLAAGSSLNTYKASALPPPQPPEREAKDGENSTQSGLRTIDHGRGGKDGVVSSENRRAQDREQQGSLVPPIEGAESQDHLSVPETGGDAGGGGGGVTVSSGASSATESWEDLEKVNGVIHHSGSNVSLDNAELDIGGNDGVGDLEVELGSVHVTEWNLAHSLKLRDMDIRPGGISKTETSEESESDSDEQGDKKRLKDDGQSDSSSSKPNSPPCQGISVPGQSSTFSPVGSQSESGAGGRESSRGEGMEWWREAMAETQNVTDDIDSLVEQLDTETDGTKRVGDGDSGGGSGLKGSNPFSLQNQSSSAIHDRSSEKKASNISSLSSDGVINLDLGALNDGERSVSRERDKELRKVAGYSSTDSVNSTGRRSKTGEWFVCISVYEIMRCTCTCKNMHVYIQYIYIMHVYCRYVCTSYVYLSIIDKH